MYTIALSNSIFQGRRAPEEGFIVGYAALIAYFKLELPSPTHFSLISKSHKKYSTQEWNVFPKVYQPKEAIYEHLVFALK